MDREGGWRRENFCGACREQPISGAFVGGDSVKLQTASLCGLEVGFAVADKCGLRSIDGK